MKLLKLLSIALIFVFAGCNETLFEEENVLNDDLLKSGKNNPLTFDTEFQIWLEEGSRTPVHPDENGFLVFDQTVLGTGNARHLGKTQLINHETLDIDDLVKNGGPMFYGSAHVIFVAANQDSLHFLTTSDLHYQDFNPLTNIILIEGTSSTFLYGTGRFKKAKDGEIHKIGMFNNNPEVLAGTATYTATVTF